MIGKELDIYINNKVTEILNENRFPDYDEIHSDSFSELIDKLIVVHIRLWYLEDSMSTESNPEQITSLKKKADITFKQKRPMLVNAIDKTIINMCKGKFNPESANPKLYKGFENDAEK